MNRGGGGTLSRQCRCRDARGVKEKALRFSKEGGGGGGRTIASNLVPDNSSSLAIFFFFFFLLPSYRNRPSKMEKDRILREKENLVSQPRVSLSPIFPLIDDAPSADKENESKENMFKTSFHFHSANNSYLLYIYTYIYGK